MFTNLVQELVTRAPILQLTADTATADVWAPINNLRDLLIAGCASVGVIVIIIAIIQLSKQIWNGTPFAGEKVPGLIIFPNG